MRERWQGIEWKRGEWDLDQWIQLTELLNSGQDFNLLGIQYPYLYRHPETGACYEVPRWFIPDAYWYKRASIQRAEYQEEQVSIFLSWEAGFNENRKKWEWIDPPREDREPVNAWDFTIVSRDQFDFYPNLLETSHGILLQLGGDTICFPEYSYRVDPLVDVKCVGSRDGETYGGLFIAPPDYQAKLFLNQIRSRVMSK